MQKIKTTPALNAMMLAGNIPGLYAALKSEATKPTKPKKGGEKTKDDKKP